MYGLYFRVFFFLSQPFSIFFYPWYYSHDVHTNWTASFFYCRFAIILNKGYLSGMKFSEKIERRLVALTLARGNGSLSLYMEEYPSRVNCHAKFIYLVVIVEKRTFYSVKKLENYLIQKHTQENETYSIYKIYTKWIWTLNEKKVSNF